MRALALILAGGTFALAFGGCGADKKDKEMDRQAGNAAYMKSEAKSASRDRATPSVEATESFDAASDYAEREVGKTAGPPERRPASRERDTADDLASRPPRRDGPRHPDGTPFQAGTLTAGSIDDNERFEEFRDYLSTALQHDAGRELPQVALGRRVVIRVENEQGEGIGDARIVVRRLRAEHAPSRNIGTDAPVLLDTTTGSDGRTLLLTGLDPAAQEADFELTVEPPDGSGSLSRRVTLDQTPWTVTLPEAESRLPRRLDLALVIDTTGSMGDELEYLKVEIDSIAAAVHERFPNVDQRYALVVYRDEGDQYVTRTFDFTGSLDEFRETLAAQSANGGGDYPEAMHLALEQSEQLSWRGRETARVAFLVADAPPHDGETSRTLEAIKRMRARGVTIFPVAASGVRERAELVMRLAALVTQAQYLFLTDHSGVGLPHARPHTPQYNVERLDQLMIRMIASKLAGRWLLPREIIGTEAGGPAVVAPRPSRHAAGQSHRPEIHRQGLGYSHRHGSHNRTGVSEPFLWAIGITALLVFVLLERAFGHE